MSWFYPKYRYTVEGKDARYWWTRWDKADQECQRQGLLREMAVGGNVARGQQLEEYEKAASLNATRIIELTEANETLAWKLEESDRNLRHKCADVVSYARLLQETRKERDALKAQYDQATKLSQWAFDDRLRIITALQAVLSSSSS